MDYFRLYESLPGRTGLGYSLGTGRWNLYGTPMIYACSASSLNFLELLSIKGSVVTQSKWRLARLSVSGDIPVLDHEFLPEDWKNRPYHKSSQEFGTLWSRQTISPILKIPSIRIPIQRYPEEHNLLINPLHPDFLTTVKIAAEWEVSFEVNQ